MPPFSLLNFSQMIFSSSALLEPHLKTPYEINLKVIGFLFWSYVPIDSDSRCEGNHCSLLWSTVHDGPVCSDYCLFWHCSIWSGPSISRTDGHRRLQFLPWSHTGSRSNRLRARSSTKSFSPIRYSSLFAVFTDSLLIILQCALLLDFVLLQHG